MDSNSTDQSAPELANQDLAFLSASALATTGRLEEAEALLCQGGKLPATPQALDLLARIAVQSSDIPRARQLWQSTLQTDPSYEPAKKALASLDTPWFALAATKRIAFLVCLAVIVGLAFVGLMNLLNLVPSSGSQAQAQSANRLQTPSKRATVPVEPKPTELNASSATIQSAEALQRLNASLELRAAQLNAQVQALQKSQAQFLETQEKTAQLVVSLAASNKVLSTQQKTSIELAEQTHHDLRNLAEAYVGDHRPVTNSVAAPAALPSLNLSLVGVSVHPHHGGWEIRFDAALFDRDDHLKIGSKSLVESTAKALVRSQEKLNIQVVGFADSEPPTWPWSNPISDAVLGQLRADRVRGVLGRLSLFPASSLSATNGPSTDLLHPGESRRNRTVILRISRSQ